MLDLGYEVDDCGAFKYDKNDDFPDFISKAARKTAQAPESFGIVLGKSGTGECIVANKIKGIRAFVGNGRKRLNFKIFDLLNSPNMSFFV